MSKTTSFFDNKTIMVFGGTGTIGSEIVNQLLKYDVKAIRIFSNSENELWETKGKFIDHKSKLRFLLGDVRDFKRVKSSLENVDYVFNAAAIKHVPISEYNPLEAIRVNILGIENIIKAAHELSVKKILHISTDKAVNPSTVMGATKMLSERVCMSRNTYESSGMTISCVRFGNVLGSRGSIIPLIKEQIERGDEVTLTSEKMMRFFMSIQEAVSLVLESIEIAKGGEIFVLKMDVVNIKDLIEVIIENHAPKIGKKVEDIKIKNIGPRIGEKLNEELLSEIEYDFCFELENSFAIYSQMSYPHKNFNPKLSQGKKVEDNLIYSTKEIKPLSKKEIHDLLIKYNLL